MNRNELKIAQRVAANVSVSFTCPKCDAEFEESKMVSFQLRCPACLLRITFYVDEGASSVFDKQRQVEKPVAVRPVTNRELEELQQSAVPRLRWSKDLEQRKKQESQRKPKRTQKQKASRKLGLQSLKERRKSR